MREILFRGKAINRDKGFHRSSYKDGDWVFGLITRLYDDRFPHCPAEMTDINGIEKIQVDYKTIGQYTGLTDKNGKKIFEGDIIRFDDEIYTVQRECDTPGGYWAETGYILKHVGWSDYTSFTETIDDWENECQVFIIGNIHDNPELLEVKK